MKLNSGVFPLVIFFISNTNCMPRPLEDHLEAEGRFHKKKHKLGYGGNNPCGTGIFGRNQAEPRTFVDWNIQLITNNYNTLCGGGGGGPIRPPGHFQHLGSHGNGILGLGLLDLFFGMGGNVQNSMTSAIDNQYDQVNPNTNVVSAAYSNNQRPRPRPYLNQNAYQNAYQNPFGNYGQDILNFNPNKVLKQANRQFNKLVKPFYDLF